MVLGSKCGGKEGGAGCLGKPSLSLLEHSHTSLGAIGEEPNCSAVQLQTFWIPQVGVFNQQSLIMCKCVWKTKTYKK